MNQFMRTVLTVLCVFLNMMFEKDASIRIQTLHVLLVAGVGQIMHLQGMTVHCIEPHPTQCM